MSKIHWVSRGGTVGSGDRYKGAIVLVPAIAKRFVYFVKETRDEGRYAIRDIIGNKGCYLSKEEGERLANDYVLLSLPGVLTELEPGNVKKCQGDWEKHLRLLTGVYIANPDLDTLPNRILVGAERIEWGDLPLP